MLFGPARLFRPTRGAGSNSPPLWGDWRGGLLQGPVILYANNSSPGGDAEQQLSALVLSASAEFKVGVLSRRGSRLTCGAHGLVQRLPPGYTLRFVLAGRTDGVTAAAMAWGSHLQHAYSYGGDAQKRVTLADDVLSSHLHYVTDGGAACNYCDFWPRCVNASGGCVPMGDTLSSLHAYHRALSLNVSLYHLDPFWVSGSSHRRALAHATARARERLLRACRARDSHMRHA